MNKIVIKAYLVDIEKQPRNQGGKAVMLKFEEANSDEPVAYFYIGLDEAAGITFGQAVKITVEPI